MSNQRLNKKGHIWTKSHIKGISKICMLCNCTYSVKGIHNYQGIKHNHVSIHTYTLDKVEYKQSPECKKQ